MKLRKIVTFLVAALLCTTVWADSIVTGSYPYIFTPGTVISSSQMNADFDYVKTQVNTNAAKNGVNSSITALLGLTTPLNQASGGSPIFDATTVGGTANAITVSATRPTISSFTYTVGNIITFKPNSVNTGATTINVNTLGAKNIVKLVDGTSTAALTGGELATTTGGVYSIYYNGTDFVLLNRALYFGTEVTIASAATVDLGTASDSHNVAISGTTTVTSFGSSANVGEPVYYVKCSGAVPFTLAASLIGPAGETTGTFTCTNGDQFIAAYFGSGNWAIRGYTSATLNTGLLSTQVFTASGTWTKPSIKVRKVLTIGTGGGGGGGSSGTVNRTGPGGGGAATCIEFIDVTAVSSVTVTVGTGGAGAASGGNPGTTGNNTSFGANWTAVGGTGASTTGAGGGGGAGGTCSGADINIDGSRGGDSTTGQTTISGYGGGTFWGPGAGGNYSNGNGYAGTAFGAGGSGAGNNTNSGGAGKDGIVWVLEFGY